MTEIGGWLRRAGYGLLPDGTSATWSIAEGRRGRRWREVRIHDGTVISSMLLETDTGRRFNHLELSTAAGLLTLHPEGDGTVHGNSIGAAGVRHVVGLPWSPTGIVLLEGSPISQAAAATSLRGGLEPGASLDVEALIIGLDLDLDRRRIEVERMADGHWAFEGRHLIEVREDGTPHLSEAADWPLER